MKFGSLFSGIGGFDLGLERAGMECCWQVEVDPFCQRVLEKHWPGVPRYGDIRTIDFKTLPRVDLMCGGFPCQDISLAGKGGGLDGDRSGLWYEFARAIEEACPSWVIIENSPALRSRGLESILRTLAAFGYDAEWHCIPASAVGAPHQRDRIWVVAHAYGEGELQTQGIQLESGRRVSYSREGETAPDTGRGRYGLSGEQVCSRRDCLEHSDWWAVEPELGRVADGISSRVDRIRVLGNSLVPQVAEWLGRRILALDVSLRQPATLAAP